MTREARALVSTHVERFESWRAACTSLVEWLELQLPPSRDDGEGGVVSGHVLPKLLPDVEHPDVRIGRAVRTARTFVREAACAVGGHDYLLHMAGRRMFLVCANCGHETPGWDIDVRIDGGRAGSGNDAAPGGLPRPGLNDTGGAKTSPSEEGFEPPDAGS